MIESVSIANIATYEDTPESLDGLSKFNFIFGSNGTGKTTISRVIANETEFPTCRIQWNAGTKLETMVYNTDFVESNFNQSQELKGVFTLGEQNVEAIEKIAKAKAELDRLTEEIETLTTTLQGADGKGGKKNELVNLEEKFKNQCWKQKQKHDAKLQGAFEGYRSSAEKFKVKVLQESTSNKEILLTLADLEKKAETVFGQTPTAEQPIASVDMAKLLEHESNPILKKRVMGKDDVDIAAMIRKLGNSDWVRQGRLFYDVNDGVCPFCQQGTEASFAKSLNDYFDEVFLADSASIDELATNYITDAARLQQQLASITASPSRFLDIEKLKAEKNLFDSKVALNNQRLAEKKKEPSQVMELDSLGNVADAVKKLLDSANTAIAKHNNTVAHLAKERKALTAQIWKFVLEELKTELSAYGTSRDSLVKAITNMNDKIQIAENNRKKKAAEISELERQTTSVQPTIDGINSLLSSFGFNSFKLAKAEKDTSYKLLRSNGTDAKTTLSEGEKNFVSFLYFYHLLKGSNSASGMTTDRVIVFDDPVSSLDCDHCCPRQI